MGGKNQKDTADTDRIEATWILSEAAAGAEEVYSWLEEIGMKDVTLKLFRGDRHELLNETNRYEIYRYLLDWMDRTTEKSGIQ